MRAGGLLVAAVLLASPAAQAGVTYTYNYDLTAFDPGIVGSFSLTTPTFINSSTFFPAIYHTDPAGHPFDHVEFRNPFQPVDGSPLSQTPVIDMFLDGFEIDSFVGGPLDQVGTYTQINGGPNFQTSLTVSLVTLGVLYSYGYDLTAFNPGIAGGFSLTAPTFLDQSRSFAPISHTDPLGHPLAYVEFRNPFQPVDGSPLSQTPVIDMFLDGFEIDSFVGGPLDQVGTYTQINFGPHFFTSLTISGAPNPIPEPSSALLLLCGLLPLMWWFRKDGPKPI
jgi:hypothetical protein